MANTTNPKSTKDLLKRLDKLAPRVQVVPGGKHLKVLLDGRVVGTLASTPSDGRTVLNVASDLRRNGVDVRKMIVTV